MESKELHNDAMVNIKDYVPSIQVDLKYAGTDNFMGQAVYQFDQAYARRGTALKLAEAQKILLAQGYSLKIWDAWRPLSAQSRMWEVCPLDSYVANPSRGCSVHSRGGAVDVTLTAADGSSLPMPTEFDDFAAVPNRNYQKYDPEAALNARRLEDAMSAAGFIPYSKEWWHFEDCDPYPPVLEEVIP